MSGQFFSPNQEYNAAHTARIGRPGDLFLLGKAAKLGTFLTSFS